MELEHFSNNVMDIEKENPTTKEENSAKEEKDINNRNDPEMPLTKNFGNMTVQGRGIPASEKPS